MTQWKYVCWMIGVAVLTLSPKVCDSAEAQERLDDSQSGRDSATDPQNVADADRPKVIGKGAYLNAADLSLFIFDTGPKPASAFLEFAQENPKSEFADEALFYAADLLIAKGQYEQVITIFDAIIEQYPHSAKFDMGACLFLRPSLHDPNYERQQAAMARARHIKDHPNFTADEAIRCKALVLEELGKRTEAVELLQQYVEDHPKGRWTREDAAVRPRLKPFTYLDRSHEMLFCHLAWLHYDDGNHGDSVEVLEQAVKNFAGCWNLIFCYDLLALGYQQMGNPTKEADALLRVKSMLDQNNNTYGLSRLERTGRENLPVHSSERIRLRIRSPEKINQRLRELDAARAERVE